MEDLFGLFIGLVGTVLVFSIPLTAIWTTHLRKMQSMKSKVIKEEIELERLKYDNFLLETEKMRLDLQNKQASLLEMSADPLVVELQKRPKAETKAL